MSGATVTVSWLLLSTATLVGCVTVPYAALSITEHVPEKKEPWMVNDVASM